MKLKIALRLSVAAFLWPMAGAMAQGSAPQPEATAPPQAAALPSPDTTSLDTAAATGGIGDIVVTATRRSENQQRVPISIVAFKGETLRTFNIASTAELPQLTPGLSFTKTLTGFNAFLRGVGTTNSGYTSENPIAVYIDGLYLPNSAAAAFGFNNIERIEVLKGPQGTLYGRNTTGGLIQVITREPGDVRSIDASASYGNYDTVNLQFYGSTPLSDTLSANFAATYTNQSDGWGRNIFLNTKAFTMRDLGFQGKLKWTPAPGTKLTLRGLYDRLETDEGTDASIYPGSVGIDGTTYLGRYNIATRRTPYVHQRQAAVSLKAEQELGFANLTAITGYIDNFSPSNNIQNGIRGNPVAGQSAINLDAIQTAKTFSQELQLASSAPSSRFQWIVGAFYYNDRTSVETDVYGTCIGVVCAAAPLPTRTVGIQKTISYSGYGEGTYSITPTTRATLGLRYTSDEKSLSGFAEPFPGQPNSPAALPASAILHPGDPFPGNPTGIVTNVTFNKLTYKAVLAQDIGETIHAYVSYNRGFKSGGFNPIVFTNPASRPEVLDAFEIGAKTELFDRRLRFNASAFYYNYRDIQLRSTAPPAPPGGSILFNAASAHIKGVDVDFVAAPVKGLQFNGGFEYLDARYASFPAGICTSPRVIAPPFLGGVVSATCDLSGKNTPSAPGISFTLGATYSFDTPIGGFALTASDGYKSKYFWESDNRLIQPAYHLVNAALTWTAKDPRYSVQLFVKNLNNAYYYSTASEGTGGNDIYVPGAPRTFGATARYHF